MGGELVKAGVPTQKNKEELVKKNPTKKQKSAFQKNFGEKVDFLDANKPTPKYGKKKPKPNRYVR